MNTTIVVVRDATLPVMQAVLVECSKQRAHVTTNLANGPAFAPQVHCSGSANGEMLYRVETPAFALAAAAAIMAAAADAR